MQHHLLRRSASIAILSSMSSVFAIISLYLLHAQLGELADSSPSSGKNIMTIIICHFNLNCFRVFFSQQVQVWDTLLGCTLDGIQVIHHTRDLLTLIYKLSIAFYMLAVVNNIALLVIIVSPFNF